MLLFQKYGVLKKWVIIMGKKQTSGLSAQDCYMPGVQGEVRRNGVETKKPEWKRVWSL